MVEMKHLLICVVISICVLFSACTNTPENATKIDKLPPIFPDYVDVTIPVGIAPLNFNVVGEVEHVDVIVKGSKSGELHANGTWAAFDVEDWHELVAANRGGKLVVTVYAKSEGKWTEYNDFNIYISYFSNRCKV